MSKTNRCLSYEQKKIIRRRVVLKQRVMLALFSLLIITVVSFNLCGLKAKAASKDEIHTYKYYKSIIIESNDSLWNIAKTYSNGNISAYIKEVKSINHLDSDTINSGMHIIVPYYSNDFIE